MHSRDLSICPKIRKGGKVSQSQNEIVLIAAQWLLEPLQIFPPTERGYTYWAGVIQFVAKHCLGPDPTVFARQIPGHGDERSRKRCEVVGCHKREDSQCSVPSWVGLVVHEDIVCVASLHNIPQFFVSVSETQYGAIDSGLNKQTNKKNNIG